MLHKMKLREEPFESIKNGTKTVEFRLYDEKRQKIQIGDQIEFSKLPDLEEKIIVNVTNLYRADTFSHLFHKLYASELEIEKMITMMSKYYSLDEEKQYGVLGIQISLNRSNEQNL